MSSVAATGAVGLPPSCRRAPLLRLCPPSMAQPGERHQQHGGGRQRPEQRAAARRAGLRRGAHRLERVVGWLAGDAAARRGPVAARAAARSLAGPPVAGAAASRLVRAAGSPHKAGDHVPGFARLVELPTHRARQCVAARAGQHLAVLLDRGAAGRGLAVPLGRGGRSEQAGAKQQGAGERKLVSNEPGGMSINGRQGRGPFVRGAVAFSATAAAATYYALRGGSYDIVVRQEEAIVVWLVVGLGFALGLLPRARPTRLALVPLAAFALLAACTALSFSWGASDERTLAELTRVLHFAGLVILVWAAVGRAEWRAAAGGLAAAAALVCALAVASRLAPDAFPENEVGRAFDTDRLNYPFNYWNAVGAWGVMATAMTLAWSTHARTLAARAAAAALIPICGVTVYLTYSRAGAAGAVVAVLVLARNRWTVALQALAGIGATAIAIVEIRSHDEIADATGNAGAADVLLILVVAALICAVAAVAARLTRLDSLRMPRLVSRLAAVAAIAAVGVVAVTAARDQIEKGWDEFRGSEPSDVRSVPSEDPASRLTSLRGGRYPIWRSAFRAYESDPLSGIGAGGFEFWWNRDEGGDEFIQDAHSLYLEKLAELGIPGLVLVLAIVLGLLAAAIRARIRLDDPAEAGAATACIAAFVAYLFHTGVDWMWEVTSVTALALAAIAVAAIPEFSPPGAPRLPLRVAVPVVAAIALFAQVPGLVSTSNVRDSQAAFNSGRTADALSNASEAIEAEPWGSTPYVQRALVEEATGELRGAQVDLRRAIERSRLDWRPRLLLARVEAKRGKVERALSAYRAARRLRPASPFVREETFRER